MSKNGIDIERSFRWSSILIMELSILKSNSKRIFYLIIAHNNSFDVKGIYWYYINIIWL